MSRICFCNLLTGIVPSSTTKLSVSTILSYSSRIRLEQPKTFRAVVRQSQVHSCFVIFQLGSPAQDAMHRNIERRTKIKRDVRNRREAIKIAQPTRRTPAGGIARKRRVDVAIRKHEIVALE